MTQNPDPRTAPDDTEDATNHGQSAKPSNQGYSAELPAEGADTDPAEDDGSPQG